jgi:hypothetical protein
MPYTEFQLGGESIASGMEINPMVPANVPNHWSVYLPSGGALSRSIQTVFTEPSASEDGLGEAAVDIVSASRDERSSFRGEERNHRRHFLRLSVTLDG